MAWVAAESKKHPGRKYYYNRETKESTWKRPVGFEEPEPDDGSSQQAVADGSLSRAQDSTRNEASMDTDSTPLTVPKRKETVRLERTDSGSSSCFAEQQCAVPEAMDCSDKWGEDVEVAMDVDVSNQLDTVIETVHVTRISLAASRPSRLEDFGISEVADHHESMERLYFVLDTNVLLSHLDFLIELKDSAIKDIGRPILVVPWVVMQELDALKANAKFVGLKARKAIHFLHGCFSSRHPRVQGQSMLEVSTEFDNNAIRNNDDRILHCCLLYQDKVKDRNGIVVLFTNDKQLYNKAVVSGVRAMDRKALLPELRAKVKASCTAEKSAPREEGGALVPGNTQGCVVPLAHDTTAQQCAHLHLQPLALYGSCTTNSSPTPSPTTPSTPLSSYFEDVPAQQKSTMSEAQVRQALNIAEIALQQALEAGIEREMKEAYDNMWMEIVALKPPWSLRDASFLIERHWLPVFGIVLHRNVKEQSAVINQHASRRPSHITSQYVHKLLQSAVFIIRAFKQKSDCGGVLTSSLDTITKLMEQLDPKNNKVTKTSLPLVTVTPLEEKKVAFQRLSSTPPTLAPDRFKWSLELVLMALQYYVYVNRVSTWEGTICLGCNEVCDSLQVPEMLRTCTTPESQLQLKSSVRQLCEVTEAVVVCLSNLQLSDGPSMQDTVVSLGRFTAHILGIVCPVSVEGLYVFLTQSEGNKTIIFNLLVELRRNLSQLVTLMT